MVPHKNKKLLLLGTGSIAAVKLGDLCARLGQYGFSYDLWLTPHACRWAGEAPARVLKDASQEAFMQSVATSEAIVITPASASAIARLAHEQGESAQAIMRSAKPIMVVPAMNIRMWQHPATQRNIDLLLVRGVQFLGPVAGDLACGDVGHGRMMEPADIASALHVALQQGDVPPELSLVDQARHTQRLEAPGHTPKRVLLMVLRRDDAALSATLDALQQRGVSVTLAVAQNLFTDAQKQALQQQTGHPLYESHWQLDPEGFEHIRLGESVDAVLLAPLDAPTARRMAMGLADDFLMATYLASKAPVLAVAAEDNNAPHPSDVAQLSSDGVMISKHQAGSWFPAAWGNDE